MRLFGYFVSVGVLAMLCGTSPAWADAIDGHWCSADGRRMNIDGPAIITPGGRHMRGNYDRHHFSYVVPIPEADAGQTVAMTLLGETVVRVQVGAGEPQLWNRCPAPLSWRLGPDQETRTGHG